VGVCMCWLHTGHRQIPMIAAFIGFTCEDWVVE
jgi:hypothetical protein